MIALRLLLVVALAFTVYAEEDLKLANRLSECFRKAVTLGVPALNYPDHNPLRIKENLSWEGNIGIASATFKLSNVVWSGIPSWEASIEQISKDTDSVAVLPYSLFWKRFVLTSDYTLKTKVGLIPRKFKGKLSVTLDDNIWAGLVVFTKPGSNSTGRVDVLDMNWTLEAVHFRLTGLGIINKPFTRSLDKLVKAYFDSGAMKNLLGDTFKEKLNTSWFAHTEKIDTLFAFCRANSSVPH